LPDSKQERTPALMLQGTGSDVGKSLLVAGLARAYVRRGLAVRPFKPQNMSNNAAVAEDGGEVGRAQALQARACGIKPSVHMNPVLLKPEADAQAQVVVHGRVLATASARDYHRLKPRLLPKVMESFARLSEQAELILIEGAGSPAEVNLRDSDIANMGFAVAAGVPVVLVGDIDRGGVIASLVGTHALISAPERARLAGYVINKFRGDVALFEPALSVIRERTGLDCLGIVPYVAAARRLPPEDGVVLDSAPWRMRARDRDAAEPREPSARAIRIAVPRLPRIANFDDLDPLASEPDVAIDMVEAGRPIPLDADLVILPGSKSTLADLAFLRAQGWDIDILAHARRGGRVIGLCAGYQMLGRRIADPDGVEGRPGESDGLGLLDVETVLWPEKTLREAHGAESATGSRLSGYEMHMGETRGPDCARPWLRIDAGPAGPRPEGASSADGRVQGCYLHGLFAADGFRRAFLERLEGGRRDAGPCYETVVEEALDELADALTRTLDLDRLLEIARGR
jgi:adenosylcobyric acid synthase